MLKIYPSKIDGEIIAPISKSDGHRALIMTYLSGGKVIGDFSSKDLATTFNVLKEMGGQFITIGNGVECIGRDYIDKKIKINCHESGSTLRFILPLCISLGIEAEIYGEGKLLSRPIEPLIKCLNSKVEKVENKIEVKGRLSGKEFFLDPTLSSQFVSGMIFALLALRREVTLTLLNEMTSTPYVDMTIATIKKFGGKVKRLGNKFIIDGEGLTYTTYNLEGDYSSSAFMLALGTLYGRVKVKNLFESYQGDRVIVDIINKMGGDVKEFKNGFEAKRASLKAIDVDIKNCLDLAPILAVLMANAKGVSHLYNVERLRLKESDRYNGILDMLKRLDIKALGNGNQIEIYGGEMKTSSLDGFNDHRMVMAGAIALVKTGGEITDEKAIEKSYKEFLRNFKEVGGKYEIV